MTDRALQLAEELKNSLRFTGITKPGEVHSLIDALAALSQEKPRPEPVTLIYRHNVLSGIADWLESRSTTEWAMRYGYGGLMRSWAQDLRDIDAARADPVAWLLTGSDYWKDRICLTEAEADRALAARKEGFQDESRKVPLYAGARQQNLGEGA